MSTHLLWSIDPAGNWRGYPGVSERIGKTVMAWALDQWQAVCDLSFRFTKDLTEAKIILGGMSIQRGLDGAYSEMPDGNGTPLLCTLNDSVQWCFMEQPPGYWRDLGRVLVHECGHMIGIGHGPEGSVMAPLYSPAIRTPQAWDIAEAVKLYGVRA